MKIIQYSPPPDIAPYFQRYGFAYQIEGHEGPIITTMNRVRGFLARAFGLEAVSRKLIEAIIYDIRGRILGEVIDSERNISKVCYFHAWAFRRRVEIAIRNGEIQAKSKNT